MQSVIPVIFVYQHLSFGADKQNSAISITELLALFQLRWSGRCDTAIHPLDRYISLCFICLGKSERSMACRWWGVMEISSLPHLLHAMLRSTFPRARKSTRLHSRHVAISSADC